MTPQPSLKIIIGCGRNVIGFLIKIDSGMAATDTGRMGRLRKLLALLQRSVAQ
jgi:hypothetical protein